MNVSAILICLSLPLCANGLDELKVALGKLQGKAPIHGTYAVQYWNRSGMGKETEETTGSASARIEDDAAGLVVRWDRATLSHAAEESKAKGEKGKTKDSPSAGITAVSALDMATAVDYAPKLLRLLERSELKQEVAETYQGKAARRLEFQVTPPMSEEDRKKLKDYSNTAQIWIGPDGLPLGATHITSTKAKMLPISMDMQEQEEFSFTASAGRLLLVKHEERKNAKTLGIETQQRTLSTFTAH